MPSRAANLVLYTVSALIVVVMVVWMQADPRGLDAVSHEDGWIENITAIGFGIGAIAFGLAAWRTPYLRKATTSWALLMTIGWALISFVCMGEEISWGQRIFHIATPKIMQEHNTQNEINIHDIAAVDNFMGGTYRWLSIYMVLGGLGIPLLARTGIGKAVFRRTYFPVLPWCYSALWVGAYLYGKYYTAWHPIPNIGPIDAGSEVREMMIGLGSAFFAIHTLLWPSDVYIGP
jgi:hypothetical protein